MKLVSIVFTVEMGISPGMRRVQLVLMNLILGFCRPPIKRTTRMMSGKM